MDSALLAGAVIASVLALQLPAAYTWITSIAGFTLLLLLFSFDNEDDRSLIQSLAFAAVCGFALAVASVIFYRSLAENNEVHMAGGRIETEWLPLTWLGATLAIWAIDRVRMTAHRKSAAPAVGPIQRGFIPSDVEPISRSASEPLIVRAAPAAIPVVAAPAPPPPPPPAPQTDIYVTLVGEGLNLMRTVKAEHVGRDFYKIVEPMPEGETWEFTPGQVVRVKKRNLSTGKALVAVEEAPRAS
jgi:amino acid transporter